MPPDERKNSKVENEENKVFSERKFGTKVLLVIVMTVLSWAIHFS